MSDLKKLPSASNQSTEKALAIIELLAAARAPMRIKEIAAELGLNSSTAFRFVSALKNCGYIEQEQESQKYYLTYKICAIANQISIHNDLQSITHPYLMELSSKIGESSCVSVENDMTMVYADVATGPDRMFMSLQKVGNTSPMHCTGNGKLILSGYSEAQLDEFIKTKGLPRLTKNTLHSKEALTAELEQVRAEGIAYDNEECEEGVRCIACPIRNYTGKIIAGVSATGPIYRMTDDKINSIRTELQKTAAQISKIMGFTGADDFNN